MEKYEDIYHYVFRIDKLDSIKAEMMLCILVNHSTALWHPSGWFNQAPAQESVFLGSISFVFGNFPTWVFTFLSGYLFFYLRTYKGKYKNLSDLIKKKTKRLLLPYLCASLAWAIPFYCFFNKCSLWDVFEYYMLGRSPSQLWFLLMLFLVFLIGHMTYGLAQNHIFIGLCFSLMLWGVGTVGISVLPNYFQIFQAFSYFVFFYCGEIFPVLWKKAGGVQAFCWIYN